MATQFGERIREQRTKQNMLQFELLMDVDTSIINIVARGDRQHKKDQNPLLAQTLKANIEVKMNCKPFGLPTKCMK